MASCLQLTSCVSHYTLHRGMDFYNAVVHKQTYHKGARLDLRLNVGSPRQGYNLRVMLPGSSVDHRFRDEAKRRKRAR